MMDEKQLLKEIAYYSKIINQHKKWGSTPTYSHKATYQPPKPFNNKNIYQPPKPFNNKNIYQPPKPFNNKYNYRPLHTNNSVINKQTVTSTTVKTPTVHINPNFNSVTIKSIHVNPKVISKTINAPSTSRVPDAKPPVNSIANVTDHKTNVRRRRSSLRTKYKIITSANTKTAINKTPTIKNKYKIDRRNSTIVNKSITRKRVFSQSISDMIRNNLFKNKTWKRNASDRKSMISHNLMNISGVLYKRSRRKLQKVQNTQGVSPKKYLASSKGFKYAIDSDRKTLKIVARPTKYALNNCRKVINLNGVKYVQKSKNVYVKSATQAVNRSRHPNRKLRMQPMNLRKNNMPCPVYCRYGKCRRKDIGRCNFHHNPNQIALCKKFLQGSCIDVDCLMSHKTTLEKMPTCKYFLEGCCVRNDCQYLHVKINPKADICRRFLEGFCKDGEKCNERHQYLCPDFERTGTCKKLKCRYPHRNKNTVVKHAKEPHKKIDKTHSEKCDIVEANRYYEDVKPDPVRAETKEVTMDEVSELCTESESDANVPRRPKLGELPSFIPFE